ncbi:hypothetical protein MUP77_18190 [Candidatus Bathyarchaeota archaeon]|nr:hypothetical protein [Candidatus Bathyarchaeota archaeon]
MPPIEAKTLEIFKEYVQAFSVKTVHCVFETNPQGNPPIGLRLYFYQEGNTYFLVDYASGGKLKVTGMPVRAYGSKKEPYIAEDDVKLCVKKELEAAVSFAFEI